MLEDLHYALRALRKQPGFVLVAALTLGFGIGVNATLFGLVSTFFLQPLPVEEPDELVFVMQKTDLIELPIGHSFPDFRDYRAGVPAFEEITAFLPNPVHLSAPGLTPERTWVELVTPSYFRVARVTAARGTLFGNEQEAGGAPAIVLSHSYWQRRFGGDPGIVGRLITLNGTGFTVVGIAPEEFSGLSWGMAVSGFVASGATPVLFGGEDFMNNRGAPAWRIMGRLREGETIETARAQVEVVSHSLIGEYPAEHKGSRAMVIPENRARPDPSMADFMPVFAVAFTGMVGLVLFIACFNVANLILARSVDRKRDLVMRSALGASRSRLIRLQVMESLILAFVAGVFGLVLSQAVGGVMAGFAPTGGDIPIQTDHGFDWRIYAFTVLISAVAGIATGLWPALHASRFDLSSALKESGTGFGSARHRIRNLLVVGQVTLSLVVLIFAGLFLRSLEEMKGLALGFQPEKLLMLSLDLGRQQYDDVRAREFQRQLEERVEALPGVTAASWTLHVPFDYGIQIRDVTVEGGVPGSEDGYVADAYTVVGHDFIETAGVLLREGRGLRETDDTDAPRVAVINRAMAEQLWPNANALGERFRFGRDGDWTEVVGVVADGRYVMLAEPRRPYFYLPLAQHDSPAMTLVVRTATRPTALTSAVREEVATLDPDLPVYNVRSMEEHIDTSVFGLMPLRMGAFLAGLQGMIGLLLAVMGLYAVVSYSVSQRTREIGVRMALGARRVQVLGLVARQGILFTAFGILLGLLIAVGVGLVLSQVLFGVRPVDLEVYTAVTALLILVAALACYLPARRATRIDPMEALRYE
jgi:predicted permease